MSENYTKGVQKILRLAKEEAVRLGQTYVGSEHILLESFWDNPPQMIRGLLNKGRVMLTFLTLFLRLDLI